MECITLKKTHKKIMVISISINILFLTASLIAFFQLGGVDVVKNYFGLSTNQHKGPEYIERTTLFKEEKREQRNAEQSHGSNYPCFLHCLFDSKSFKMKTSGPFMTLDLPRRPNAGPKPPAGTQNNHKL